MHAPSRQDVLSATEQVIAGTQDPALQPLLERVLEHVATEDLAEREPRDLVGAVASLRALAGQRAQAEALVRVLSPTVEADGWASRHSIVQICTDDMPFLVDSVTAAMAEAGLTVHLIVHPQIVVRRDGTGALAEVREERPPTSAGTLESWMHLEVDRLPNEKRRTALVERLERVLTDVRRAVEDWAPMRHACEEIARELEWGAPPTVDPAEVAPARELLSWLADNHFTFLGYRAYALDVVDGEDVLRPVPGTGLGILRDDPRTDHAYSRLRPEGRASARDPRLLTITKANSRATVHRAVYLDYVGIRTFDADGNVTGERRFLGMFTSAAYAESVLRLPIVADKVRTVLNRSGFAPHSHSGKDLLGVLEAYPRDELFQTDVDTLAAVTADVLYLQERRKAKLFLRRDEFGRFVSALVYIPRDRYNTAARLRMEAILREAYGAEHVDYTTRVAESALAQLHFVVRVPRGEPLPEVDPAHVQARLLEAIRTWEERLVDAVHADRDEATAARMTSRYVDGFPEAYKEDVSPEDAVYDLEQLQGLESDGAVRVHLAAPPPGADAEGARDRRFKLYRRTALTLTDVLPTFTDLGVEVVDERPYHVRDEDGAGLHVYDFGLRARRGEDWGSEPTTAAAFEAAFLAVTSGQAESDGLGALVLGAGLQWRQVLVLRTIARYLRQIGSAFSVEYLEAALVANPHLAAQIVALFEARFDPDRDGERAAEEQRVATAIEAGLEDVASLDHDRIVRAFVGVVRASLRTNFYKVDAAGEPLPRVSIKLDCHAVPGLPLPRPKFEIWVYSPQVEGAHLRFGMVARGGLRWSDRREDFRTEVLGLVKAQMVKNAVIVPTGSKGAFFAKQLPDPAADRGAWLAEGKEAYRTFIRGLLDVTDNRVGSAVVPPERVIRHDGDDPYLVVAADKGTASFSDVANALAQDYGFWLDDAFASGGSAGYDHKAMGITARGAWESVKRHFRELGQDTQSEDFTAVGIGDMSGDVFGNGMLLSEHTRLVAAFDHRHVFLDPNPDAASSYAERRRLFELPGSSWADYNTDLISEGGGVHARAAKSVPITAQVREALGLGDGVESLTPAELIKAVLLAPVDLVFNGGIGTYIKSAAETNAEIGDRANDAIRVNGGDLRCRVVGEGGNLGASQLGRIEAAQAGVSINTDAIDNSAGVGTSDREVNIKILLTSLTKDGTLTLPQRNELLAEMTDQVAAAVLRDNYEQNVLLMNSRAQTLSMLPVHTRLIGWLEERGELDRALEYLPSNAELAQREAAGTGLTQPEFSVLVAYAKLALKADLAATDLAEDEWFTGTLAEYFPSQIRERYGDQLAGHPLRREIIVNAVVNSLVNRGGTTFAFRAGDETGATSEQIARAYVVCREVFGLGSYVAAVEALDNVVASSTQTTLYLEFRRLLDRVSRWFLHNRPDTIDVGAEVQRFGEPVARLTAQMGSLLRGAELERYRTRVGEFEALGVPTDLAERAASLLPAFSLLDVVQRAEAGSEELDAVAALYFATSDRLGMDELLAQVAKLPRDDRWDSLARGAMRDDLYATLDGLTASIQAGSTPGADPAARLEEWVGSAGAATARAEASLAAIRGMDDPGIAPLSVALRTLRGLVR